MSGHLKETPRATRTIAERQNPADLRGKAKELIDRGFAVCRVRKGEKNPGYTGWTTLSADADEFSDIDNLGIMGGWLSDGDKPGHALVIVDLDNPDALRFADDFLPPTGMTDGRVSKPRSHRYYLVPVSSIPDAEVSAGNAAADEAVRVSKHPGPRVRHFKSDGGGIDLIGTGGQVVAPPSVHASGERREWDGAGEPAVVDYAELTRAVDRLAKAVGCTVPGGWWLSEKKASERTPQVETCVVDYTGVVRVNGRAYTVVEREERATKYLEAIPDADLSRPGQGGSSQFIKHLRAVANGYMLPRNAVERWAALYNERLIKAKVEQWLGNELAHKIDDAVNYTPSTAHPPGHLLKSTEFIPRAADDPGRLADEFLEHSHVWFIKDTAFLYADGRYTAPSEPALSAVVRQFIEKRMTADYERRVKETERVEADLTKRIGEHPEQAKQLTGELAAVKRVRPKAVRAVTRHLVQEAVAALRSRRQRPDEQPLNVWLSGDGPDVVGVDNGLLDVRSGKLIEANPNWLSLVTLPVQYDPTANCPKWEALLAQLLDKERSAVLGEVFGACLMPGFDAQFFCGMVGDGANGKSVVMNVLRYMLGDENTSAVPLDQLSKDKFASYDLLGKLANLIGDQSFFDANDTGWLKDMTGGNPIRFEAKGRQSLKAVNTARMIFSCNELPVFTDRSNGIWRRAVLIPFEYVVPEGERNPALMTRDYWRDELPGILNWSIRGLNRLRANHGRFAHSAKCAELHAKHRTDSNPARAYLTECYEVGDGSIPSAKLWSRFQTWCNDNGHKGAGLKRKFSDEVKRVFPNAVSKTGRVEKEKNPVQVWEGIKPKPECEVA